MGTMQKKYLEKQIDRVLGKLEEIQKAEEINTFVTTVDFYGGLNSLKLQ
jgi:hypothetical protein